MMVNLFGNDSILKKNSKGGLTIGGEAQLMMDRKLQGSSPSHFKTIQRKKVDPAEGIEGWVIGTSRDHSFTHNNFISSKDKLG